MPWPSPCITARSIPFAVFSYVKWLFTYTTVCLTTGLQSPAKRDLHSVRSTASFLNFHYPLFSLRSSSNCLHFLPLHPVNCILPSIFPSTTCFRRQFLHKMWPIQLAFLLFTVYMIFLSNSTLCNTSSFLTISPTDLLHPSPAPDIKSSETFPNYFPNCPIFSTTQSCAPSSALYWFLPSV